MDYYSNKEMGTATEGAKFVQFQMALVKILQPLSFICFCIYLFFKQDSLAFSVFVSSLDLSTSILFTIGWT